MLHFRLEVLKKLSQPILEHKINNNQLGITRVEQLLKIEVVELKKALTSKYIIQPLSEVIFNQSNLGISKEASDLYCIERLKTIQKMLKAHGVDIKVPSLTTTVDSEDKRIPLSCSEDEIEKYFMRLTSKDENDTSYFTEENVKQLLYSNFRGFDPARPKKRIVIERKGLKQLFVGLSMMGGSRLTVENPN